MFIITDTKHRHSSGVIEKREKHLGDLRHMVADGNPKPDKIATESVQTASGNASQHVKTTTTTDWFRGR